MTILKNSTTAEAAGKPRKNGTPPANRVTVRLKPQLAQRLAAARDEQHVSVSSIIEAALEKHLADIRRKSKLTLLEALEKHGVLGAADLGSEAASQYKQLVSDSIAGKYGYR